MQRHSRCRHILGLTESNQMEIPKTLLPAEHYIKHFVGTDKLAVELLKVKTGEAQPTNFRLSPEALAALEKIA